MAHIVAVSDRAMGYRRPLDRRDAVAALGVRRCA